MKSLYYDEEKNVKKKPLDASTVIFVQYEKGKKPFEIFLMQRNKNLNFMGNAFVFPGGKLDKADCDDGLIQYADGLSAQKAKQQLNEPDLCEKKALGLFFTAVRETFEESGVLLAACIIEGKSKNIEAAKLGSIINCREKVHRQEISLKKLAEKENIHFSLNLLKPYSRWITPEFEKKRFDTRFFVAKMPEDQISVHDSLEMVSSLWITPSDALLKHEAGDLLLMPPTLKTIEELSEFQSIDDLLSSLKSKKILPILPQAFSNKDESGVLLPHDPDYSIAEYKQHVRSSETSRIVSVNGKWKKMTYENNR